MAFELMGFDQELDRIQLTQEDIPTHWYNILQDLPAPLPAYKDVESGREIRRLPDTFTKTASKLEFAEERWIKIPEGVIDAYLQCGRPTSLIRALRLEKFLKTPARIYYKCEDLHPVGNFKMNATIPQAYWAMKENCHRTVFAGIAGTRSKFAHVFAAKSFGIKPTLFMTRVDCQQNREQVFLLKKMLEADLVESPSLRTKVGRKLLEENPKHPGSRATREQEVAEELRRSEDAATVVSSFLNHVLMTQTVVGLEVEKQLKLIDEKPDILVASAGSGSLFYGLIAPFARDRFKGRLRDVKFLAVESEISSKLTNGTYEYLSRGGALASFSVKAHSFSSSGPPSSIKAKGIQIGTAAPLVSMLRHLWVVDTCVYSKDEKAVFDAARVFLQTEGRLLAPESAYSVRAVMDKALEAKKKRERIVIVTGLSGATYLDFGEKTAYSNLG